MDNSIVAQLKKQRIDILKKMLNIQVFSSEIDISISNTLYVYVSRYMYSMKRPTKDYLSPQCTGNVWRRPSNKHQH